MRILHQWHVHGAPVVAPLEFFSFTLVAESYISNTVTAAGDTSILRAVDLRLELQKNVTTREVGNIEGWREVICLCGSGTPELNITFLNIFLQWLTKLEARKYVQKSVPAKNEENLELLKCTGSPDIRHADSYRLRYKYCSQTYVHNRREILLIIERIRTWRRSWTLRLCSTNLKYTVDVFMPKREIFCQVR